jgi:hypothetical protein
MKDFNEDLLVEIAERHGLKNPNSSTVIGYNELTCVQSFVGARVDVNRALKGFPKEMNMERVSYHRFYVTEQLVCLLVFWNNETVNDPVVREEEPEPTHVDEFIDMRTLESGIKVWRTGNLFSFASNQFGVEYPDGVKEYLWSPPWHEMEADEEYDKLIEIVEEKWKKGLRTA